MKRGAEYSNTFPDEPSGGEVGQVISEQDSLRLNAMLLRAVAFPSEQTEGTSPVNLQVERLVTGEVDGRSRTLHFFIYWPAEVERTHRPYDPSIMAEYRLGATDDQPDNLEQRIYLSRKHLDTSNSRYDGVKVQENFARLEQALAEYEAALAAGGQASS